MPGAGGKQCLVLTVIACLFSGDAAAQGAGERRYSFRERQAGADGTLIHFVSPADTKKCEVAAGYRISIDFPKQPLNGTLSAEVGNRLITAEYMQHPQSICWNKSVKGAIIKYTANAGFRGHDYFSARIRFEGGRVETHHINVRIK